MTSQEDTNTPMTVNQLASSVRQGRRVIFGIFDEDPVEGYLSGWDDSNYFVVFPAHEREYYGKEGTQQSVAKVIIPKGNYIELRDARTFREEPLYEEMNKIVKPFRDFINKKYFSHVASTSSAS